MPIDSSIALQVRPIQIEPQTNALARVLQLQGLQQQNALGAGQLQDAQAAREEKNALRAYLGNTSTNLDTPEGIAGLYRAAPLQAQGILKGRLDLTKTQTGIEKDKADAAATLFKTEHAKYQAMADLIGSATDQASYDAAKARGAAMGLTPDPNAPAQFDPRYVANAQQQALTTVQRIEQAARQRGLDLQQRGQDMTASTARRGQDMTAATARRGQDMVDARSRETTAAAMTKPFEVTGPDGLPVLVQQDRQGNITPVQGFGPKSGSNKPLTDSQAKALLFGSRMQEADKILTGMASKGVNMPSVIKQAAESVPLIGGALGAAANSTVASADQQSVEQAQRDFVNAVLRRESGAAISPSEFDSAKKQYFPAVGDSKQVQEQKAKNRQLAIQGLLAEVPEGRRSSLSRPAAGGWSVTEVK